MNYIPMDYFWMLIFSFVLSVILFVVLIIMSNNEDYELRRRLGISKKPISHSLEIEDGIIKDIHSYQQKIDKKINLLIDKNGYKYIDKSTDDVPRLEKKEDVPYCNH